MKPNSIKIVLVCPILQYFCPSIKIWLGPVCRSSITAEKLFSRSAFEPSEEDLDPSLAKPKPKADTDEDPNSVFWRTSKGKGKAKTNARGKTKAKSKRVTVIDSGDECYSEEEEASEDYDDDDNMSDFIVDSDEDEDYEEKSASRAIKKRLTKRTIVLDSDDEMPDEQVVFGLKPVTKPTPAAHDGPVMMMPKFLPSTKMKVRNTCMA